MTNNPEDKDYEVGYKRPPSKNQFKPGQSGNPKGRPKKPKTIKDALVQALSKEILVGSNGQKTKMTLLEALGAKLVNDALNGDKQARNLIMKDYSHNIQIFDREEEDMEKGEEMSKSQKYFSEKNFSPIDKNEIHMEALRFVRHMLNEHYREKNAKDL